MKSPPAAAPKASSLSAVGVKKPLSTAAKKAPVTGATQSTTFVKKLPGKVSAVKKTTTTTTVQKKVVNGDIVTQETTTTVTDATSGDAQLIEDILKDAALNGHMNGNGIAENGQMVLDSAAD